MTGLKRALLVLFAPLSAHASLSAIMSNNEGVKLFEKQRQLEAYSHFAQSLGQMPFEARVHYNLATSYLANKEFEKAMSEYAQAARLAEKSGDLKLQFASHFNAGIAATELKQVDQALAEYQAALAVGPDSVETKTNIELLIQSQGGGGDSKDQKDQKDKKDKKGDKDQKKDQQGQGKDQKPPEDQKTQGQQQPKPFESKELTQQDAQRIMEELKRQEEEVRARFQNDHVRDVPRDKDW